MSYSTSGKTLPWDKLGEKPKSDPKRGNKVGRLHGPIDQHVFPYPGASHHHPGGSRIRVAGAVMLKAIAAGGYPSRGRSPEG